MTETTPHSEHFAEHKATYEGFLKGSIALTFISLFVLVALCSVGFGATMPRFLAFAGVIIGIIVTLIDMRSGTKVWPLSLGFLVVYGLLTAINVS
jgi:uncharacterized membrane protein SpoIIM required for sporulation